MTYVEILGAGSLRAMGTRLESVASQAAIVMEEGIEPLAAAASNVFANEIRMATPVGFTGDLARSTTPATRISGLRIDTLVYQPAESKPNPYRKKPFTPFMYGISVRDGRKEVNAISPPEGSGVLWGEHFGPAQHAGPAPADPYQLGAIAAAEPQISGLVRIYGEETVQKLADLL